MTIFGLLSPDGRWLWVSLIHLKVWLPAGGHDGIIMGSESTRGASLR